MDQYKASGFYSLITGASSGIGKVIAKECAKRSMNLILVALDDADLVLCAQELKGCFLNIKVHIIPVDLADSHAAQYIFDYCQDHCLAVNMLINNAAIGASGRFDSHPAAFHEYAIKVNLMTPLLLTRLFLPGFKQLDKAYILNVSSGAAFFDMPYKTIYAATKTFVYSFTRAIREELKDTGVTVSVMCSGGVVTNAETKKRCEELGYLSRKLQLSAELVAIEGLNGLLNSKRLILPGLSSKLFFLCSKLLPYRLKLFALRKIYGPVYHERQVQISPVLETKAIVPVKEAN